MGKATIRTFVYVVGGYFSSKRIRKHSLNFKFLFMKYEDLKCEFCDGNGETEKYVEPYGDSPVICTFCNGTGVDLDQIEKFKVSITSLSNEEQKSQLHKQYRACASGEVDKTVCGWPKLCKAENNKTCEYPSCYCPDITQGV